MRESLMSSQSSISITKLATMTFNVISLSISLHSFVIASQCSLVSNNTVFVIDVCKRLISEFNVSMVTIYRVRRLNDFFFWTAPYTFWKCFKTSLTILTFSLTPWIFFSNDNTKIITKPIFFILISISSLNSYFFQ